MKKWILYLILIIAFILEGTITTLPLVLMSFLILMIFLRTKFLFWLTFLVGIALDVFLLRTIGITSLMLVIFLFIVLLYEKKFETSTSYFILIISFFGSLIYLLVLNQTNVFFQALFISFLSLGIFKLLMLSEIKKPRYKLEK